MVAHRIDTKLETIRKMEYQYSINKPFLGLDFKSEPIEVERFLGKPDKTIKNDYSSDGDEYDLTYVYDQNLLRIVFSYDNGKFDQLSIYTKVLNIDGLDLFKQTQHQVLNIISANSNMELNDAYKETVNLDQISSVEYNFKDIGISLWFEEDFLNEVCFYKPS